MMSVKEINDTDTDVEKLRKHGLSIGDTVMKQSFKGDDEFIISITGSFHTTPKAVKVTKQGKAGKVCAGYVRKWRSLSESEKLSIGA